MVCTASQSGEDSRQNFSLCYTFEISNVPARVKKKSDVQVRCISIQGPLASVAYDAPLCHLLGGNLYIQRAGAKIQPIFVAVLT